MACLHPSKRRTFWSEGDEEACSSPAASACASPSVSCRGFVFVTPLRTDVQWVASLKPVPEFVNVKLVASGD